MINYANSNKKMAKKIKQLFSRKNKKLIQEIKEKEKEERERERERLKQLEEKRKKRTNRWKYKSKEYVSKLDVSTEIKKMSKIITTKITKHDLEIVQLNNPKKKRRKTKRN